MARLKGVLLGLSALTVLSFGVMRAYAATGDTIKGQKAYDSAGKEIFGLDVIDGKTYLFDAKTGLMEFGLQTAPNGKTYYFNPSTGAATYGTVNLGAVHAHPNDDGNSWLYDFDGKTGVFVSKSETLDHPADMSPTKTGAARFDVVDVSSNNQLTQADFTALKKAGVKTVAVKLTGGTSYVSPCAAQQVADAESAGLPRCGLSLCGFWQCEDAGGRQ